MEALPIGTIRTRITTNGRQVRFVKVSHHGQKRQRWRPLARHWWEHNVGPIPDGHQVCYRDGNSLNDSPPNLVLAREDRIRLILSRSPARNRRSNRQRAAVARSNQSRARIANAVLRPDAWYIVLPQTRAILWAPCRRRTEAKELFSPEAIAELCAKDEAILTRRDSRTRNVEPFEVGHPILYVRGRAIEAGSSQDGQFEGFIRLIPDTRKPPRKRKPKFLPPDLVTVCGDGYVSEPLSNA